MLIDVSEHNGNIDWAKVKAAGVTGVIVRCGFGQNYKKQDDAKFKQNMDGAINAGLDIGVYMYSYAKNAASAKSEAEHTLRLVDPYKDKITLPIYYDLEENSISSVAKSNAVVFGDIIEKAGYWCGVYASLSWFKTYLKGLDKYTKWVAAWGKDNGKPGTKPSIACDLWQYTSKGKVNGINGYVDCDELLTDLPAKIRAEKAQNGAGGKNKDNNPQNGSDASQGNTEPKKTIDQLAKEVLAGKWGNGVDRKERLTKAGYDYNKVQDRVNEMLYGKKVYLTVNTISAPLNMRATPNGKVIGSVPKGKEVELIEKTNASWYKVKYNGKTGYCYSKYLKA
ncbi:MAG: SH3 domain-containing protein [Elusimicrobiaceae bacterium]|nr:SH3 domain-containing protein [Elusimicrobiaceae bacterium]